MNIYKYLIIRSNLNFLFLFCQIKIGNLVQRNEVELFIPFYSKLPQDKRAVISNQRIKGTPLFLYFKVIFFK
jgi:hypothetical protein